MDLPKPNQQYMPENGVNVAEKEPENETAKQPKAETKPPAGEVKNDYSKDVNNIENIDADFLNELQKDRETFEPTPDNPYSKDKTDGRTSGRDFGIEDLEEPEEPVDEETAKKNGMNMARTVSSLNAWLTSRISKDKMEKYKCTDEELEDLADVYSDLSQTYNMKMPPWISAVIVSVFVLGPKWADAKEARDQQKINDEQERLKSQLSEQNEENKKLRDQINRINEKLAEKD